MTFECYLTISVSSDMHRSTSYIYSYMDSLPGFEDSLLDDSLISEHTSSSGAAVSESSSTSTSSGKVGI